MRLGAGSVGVCFSCDYSSQFVFNMTHNSHVPSVCLSVPPSLDPSHISLPSLSPPFLLIALPPHSPRDAALQVLMLLQVVTSSSTLNHIPSYPHLQNLRIPLNTLQYTEIMNEAKQAAKNNRIIDCLLQMHIAEEETKFGFNRTELEEVVLDLKVNPLPYVRITGLMGMATFTENKDQIRTEFKIIKNTSDWLQKYIQEAKICSIGMSGDYELAIEEGSTMIRLGSKIFGSRNY